MTGPPARLVLRRPDDWHVHLRDGMLLPAVLPWTARVFGRAMVMPNLVPPVTDRAAAAAYRARILAALPPGSGFRPLMACYLTDMTDPGELAAGREEGIFHAAKLYPAGATTHSDRGVISVAAIRPVLERMQRIGLPLLVHGEVTDPEVDVFDREAVFVERVLAPVRRDFPELPIVLEHVTTEEATAFVREAPGPTAATVTPHHLVLNRSDLFRGGLRPHLYCLPVAKRERHRLALVAAAVSGSPRFFLGTDSAPHPAAAKEAACCAAGIFNAPAALQCYAAVFAAAGALDRLEGFAALHGAAFYGLPPNENRIVLERAADEVPPTIAAGLAAVAVFAAERARGWRIAPDTDAAEAGG